MEQALKHLMELQKVDSQLVEIEGLKGDLPHQVSRLNRDIEEAEEFLGEQEEKLRVYQRERGIVEMDIRALEGKQKQYQSQLFEVKTNREYDAITHEIESAKVEKEKKETRLLELMEQEEASQKAIEVKGEEIERLKKQLEEKKADLKERLQKTEKEEATLRDRRGKILRNLDARLLANYERIRKAKNGLAVVPILRNACGGCFKTLPPQRILEIREMNHLRVCEVCGRMLVWDEAVSEKPE